MKHLKRFLTIGLIILILNLIWEFSHYQLYIDLSGISKYPHLIIASLADMIIVLGIFTVISLKNRGCEWMKSPSKSDYSLVLLMGISIAMLIELMNVRFGRWQYTGSMPTLLGVGITPLIQLTATGIVSLIIFHYIQKR